MSGVFVFDESNASVRYLLKAGQGKISISLWTLETVTDESINIVKCRDFEMYLSFFSYCYMKVGEEIFLIYPKVKCNTWNQIVIEDGFVEFNDFSLAIPVKLSENLIKLQVGDLNLRALILFNSTQYTEYEEDKAERVYESSNLNLDYVGDIKPIKSLSELLLWEPDDLYNASVVPYRKLQKIENRELLVCHDFGGNYKEDVGITNLENSYKYFHFIHTDIFIYFTHSLVTIPPASWVDSAHKAGTLILGTFITEGDEGKKENEKLCKNINQYCEYLIKLMAYYNFDGYLINIEADCELPYKMLEFIQTLTLGCKRINPNSKIIWYDSMDLKGEINWKSCLNEDNILFLQATDGFFTDYHWKKGMPESSAKVAGEDTWKVYTGTDVYGRGTWGGGGFDTKIGVEDSLCTSCAIFAPGWTFHYFGENFSSFLTAENMLWAERANPIIDSGGKVFKDRETTTKLNALYNWECYIGQFITNETNLDWKRVYNPNIYWEVTDDIEFVSSFAMTKRVVRVDLLYEGIGYVDNVVANVQVKGTGPKFDDYYWVELQVKTQDGKIYSKVEQGQTSDEWKSIKVEIFQNKIEEIVWTEGGFDNEHWQGFHGSRFRQTNVVYKQQGKCILDYFEEKVWTNPVCTWFCIGQGVKVVKKGQVLKEGNWNSLNDFDIMPSMTVMKNFDFEFDKVYQGTNSIIVPKGCYKLFKCNFNAEKLSLRLVYIGEVKLFDEKAELVSSENDGEWIIDNYLLNGVIGDVVIDCQADSILAGMLMYKDYPKFVLEDFEYELVWNLKSLDSDLIYFDIEGQFNNFPEFIRHIDVFVNDLFVTRAYRARFRLTELPAGTETVKISFIAEDLKADEASRYELFLSLEDIKKIRPLE